MVIIDTQTVKCIPVGGPCGFDAAKRTSGRKRVAMVDADGGWLAVAVVPASVQERDTVPELDNGKAAWPSLRMAILDVSNGAQICSDAVLVTLAVLLAAGPQRDQSHVESSSSV